MRHVTGLGLALILVAVACGGSDSATTTVATITAVTTTTTTTTTTPTTTTTAAPTTTTTTAAPTTTTTTAAPTTTAPTTSTTAPVKAALWVTNGSESKVFKIDPATGDTLLEIDVGTNPAGIALGAGSAWVAMNGEDYLLRLSAETGAEEARITVGNAPAGVAFADGLAWVSRFAGTVTAIDPASNTVKGVSETGEGATGLAAGSVWVTTWTSKSLIRIITVDDPASAVLDLGGEGSSPAVGGGFVGATLFSLGQFSVFDETTLDPIDTYDTGSNANVATYGFGAFWVTNSNTGEVYRIDPVAGTSDAMTTIPGALGITTGDDMVYVASFDRGVVYQFPPDNPSAMIDLADTGSSAFELAYGTAD